MDYPKLYIANHQMIVSKTRSRAIKRNISCIQYNTEEGHSYGLVQKILTWQDSSGVNCYLIVDKLNSAQFKLCNDQVTSVKLEDHYAAFNTPGLVYCNNTFHFRLRLSILHFTSCKYCTFCHFLQLTNNEDQFFVEFNLPHFWNK